MNPPAEIQPFPTGPCMGPNNEGPGICVVNVFKTPGTYRINLNFGNINHNHGSDHDVIVPQAVVAVPPSNGPGEIKPADSGYSSPSH